MDIVQDDGTDRFDCNEFVEEVSSWIHDERRCVTTQTVAWTFGLSRRQASQVLTQCCIPSPSDGQDHDAQDAKSSYNVVWMQADEESDSDGTRLTVVRFIKSTLSGLEIQQQEQSKQPGRAIYAISFNNCTESLTTAHTKDQQLFRDALQSQQHATVLNHNCIEIQSSIDLDRHDVGQFQQERRNHMGQVATDRPGAAKTTSMHNDYNKNKTMARKTTTAQAFFRGSSSTTTTTLTPTTKNTADAHPTQSKTKKPFFGTSSVSKSTVTTTTTTSTTTTTKQGKEKEKQMRATSVEKENAPNVVGVGVGTADDFMGDEDEDEEFLLQEKLRHDRRQQETQRASSSAALSSSQRSGRPEPQQPQSKSASTASASSNMAVVQDNDDDDDDDMEHEPQTPRQQQQQQPPPPPAAILGKKRRKKLVEKTTMDAHGYMHTETHVEWEEIDVVDEPITTVEKKKVVKNTKNMKQGSLMGFFAKK